MNDAIIVRDGYLGCVSIPNCKSEVSPVDLTLVTKFYNVYNLLYGYG